LHFNFITFKQITQVPDKGKMLAYSIDVLPAVCYNEMKIGGICGLNPTAGSCFQNPGRNKIPENL